RRPLAALVPASRPALTPCCPTGRAPPSLPAMTSLRRSDGSDDGGGGSSGSGGGRVSSRCGAVRWGVSGGGQMHLQRRLRESLPPQQLRDWYTSRSGGRGSSGSRCIEAATLGASESALPGTAPGEAMHTFTLDSGASRYFFCDSTTLTPLPAPVPVRQAGPFGSPQTPHTEKTTHKATGATSSSPTTTTPTTTTTATLTAATTASAKASTPTTTPTTATTPIASTTSISAPTTTPVATTTTPATLALAAAALPTSRSSPDILSTKDVNSSSRGVGGSKGRGGKPLKEGRARSARSGTYSDYTSLSCKEVLLE
ncbi:unnamed protein product, partial [Closterium sp. NIES-54]